MQSRISGQTLTALITPFYREKVDYDSLEALLQQQVEGGIEGFVVGGTTGEGPTLEPGELKEIFFFCRKTLKKISSKYFPLVVGTGTNSTKTTIEKTKLAKEWGADAALVVAPYYNKPPQEGLLAHFQLVAQMSDIPILLYNVPGRTVVALEVPTVLELMRSQNIVGIKEASGRPEFFNPLLLQAKKQSDALKKSWINYSGDDGSYLEFLKSGGDGIISVATHVIPRSFVNWKQWLRGGEQKKAELDFDKNKNLMELLFLKSNPIPVKAALLWMGVIRSSELRLPLVQMSENIFESLKQEMLNLKVLK